MTLLSSIIADLKSDNHLQTIRILCDRIKAEEDKSTCESKLPKGPNILLSLEVPGRTEKEIGCLSLERESESMYLAVFSFIKKDNLLNENIGFKRLKVWEINNDKPEKILTEYAKHYKFLRGE